MKRIKLILTGLSIAILLLSLNRLTSFTSGYLQPFEYLRWLDFNAMLPIPLLSIVLYYFLLGEVVGKSAFAKTRNYSILMLVFIVGIYLFGASSGDHEVTNYLNTRFCDRGAVDSPICNIIKYNDDEFSHIVYYLGFILLNIPLMVSEYFAPRKSGMSRNDYLVVLGNAVFIGLGIFANLAFEEIGLDLYFFGSMMLLALYLLYKKNWKIGQYPVLLYFAASYTLGVVGTVVYKLFV